jgi:hypothetical protein
VTAPTDGSELGEEARQIEQRAAEVRLRLMQTMDALGAKRRAFAVASRQAIQNGSKVMTVTGLALVAAAGVAVGVAVWSAAARARRRSIVIGSLFPALEWRRPPQREPSVLVRTATSLLMGAASTGLELVMRRLVERRPIETEDDRLNVDSRTSREPQAEPSEGRTEWQR